MSRILVSGLVNMETTLQVEEFPISYTPGRFPFHGVRSRTSGVGYNVAKALLTLGDEVSLVTLLGNDPVGKMVEDTLARDGLSGNHIVKPMEETPQTVVLYDRTAAAEYRPQGHPGEGSPGSGLHRNSARIPLLP